MLGHLVGKYVYFFGNKMADGNGKMKELLGGKGANLAEMCRIGFPVPAGFTITTDVCNYYYAHGQTYPPELKAQVMDALGRTERAMGAKFGDAKEPLLVSCRSGGRVSMPGMMDTVLNIGLNEKTLDGLMRSTGNERFVWDSYRRFVQMYGDVVLGLKAQSRAEIDPFDKITEELKHIRDVRFESDLNVADLRELVFRFKKAIREYTGRDFPEDPMEQIWGAVGAVFRSWNNDRAIVFRRLNGYPHDWGTAANICSMVFGNMGDDSGTGVAFTRDPATGENVLYGEYLLNAQGEDVVAGIRTPVKIAELQKEMPAVHKQLEDIRMALEKHYSDMQDFEFTIQQGKLWMLQTRNGKRTGAAAVRIALDMVEEGLITEKDALSPSRLSPDDLNQFFQPVSSGGLAQRNLLAQGISAGGGAATGRICLFGHDAERIMASEPGAQVILVRHETSPEDIRGIAAASGVLTTRGGSTSHAAVLCRQMGKVCVVGCDAVQIDYSHRIVRIGSAVLREGDLISIDGTTGEVFAGSVAVEASEVLRVINRTLPAEASPVYRRFQRLMEWADERRQLGVRANADTPEGAAHAIAFGAEGIGLCRTEHMFFGQEKIGPMREMILAETTEQRRAALTKLLPLQRADFEGIFRVMCGHPVTIRTIDPPLHEFLPHDEDGQRVLADEMGITLQRVQARVQALHEFNPMLGFRGCRVGIIFPEIIEMQARAIFEAARNVAQEGIGVEPEVMIPTVAFVSEFKAQAKIVRDTAEKVFAHTATKVPYLVGTMIEVPRACVVADQIAKEAEFFSFGTNDLTQATLAMSRDDSGGFISQYVKDDLLPADPFEILDEVGVGALMRLAVERGRSVRPDLKIGICGEHGGEPHTIRFCHEIGLDYISTSPFRVPIARFAAAQASLKS